MKWDGNLQENWRKFNQAFKFYLTSIGYDSKGAKVKTSLLLTCMGERGHEVYNTFKLEVGQELDLVVVTACFEVYFKPRKNIIFERYKFKSCN